MRPVRLLAIALGMAVLAGITSERGAAAVPPAGDPPGHRPVPRADATATGPATEASSTTPVPATPCGRSVRASWCSPGAVAGQLYVTVSAPRRSAEQLLVPGRDRGRPSGCHVGRGAVIGTAGERMHLGVRRGDRYLDPATLFRPQPSDPGRDPPPSTPHRPALGGRRPIRLASSAGHPASSPHDRGRCPQHTSPGAPSVASAWRATRADQPKGKVIIMAAVVTMKQLLEAGVHFGHQTRRWNPKMKRFIHGEHNGIYIIDLRQTLERIEKAYTYTRDLVADGGTILFVGTKRQAQDSVQGYAEKCGMPYINQRWLGGMLTNFETISKRVGKMKDYQRMRDSGEFEMMPKKEALLLGRELDQARAQPRRHPQPREAPRRGVHPRHQEGGHRGDRGQQARPPDRRRGRHQLRPRRHPVRDPGQRRRHPLRRAHGPCHLRGRRGGPPDPRQAHRLEPPRPRTAEEEAEKAAEQAEARRQAALAAAEREARIAAAQGRGRCRRGHSLRIADEAVADEDRR